MTDLAAATVLTPIRMVACSLCGEQLPTPASFDFAAWRLKGGGSPTTLKGVVPVQRGYVCAPCSREAASMWAGVVREANNKGA